MSQDYYETLGVSRDCSQEEIKRAYRRLARRYHPDVCKEDGAEDRFKEISKAYAVLSDPQKRRRYDMYGEDGLGAAPGGDVNNIFDLFDQVFGGGMGGGFGRQAQQRGRDLQYEVTIDLQGVVEGYEADLEVNRQAECERCGGTGAAEGSMSQTCEMCGGRGVVTHERATLLGVMATTSTCPNCGGRGTIIRNPCGACAGRGVVQTAQRVNVKIPPGIEDGQSLRLAGQGDMPAGGGIPGDLYITVRVAPHDLFTRRGRDLHMNLDLTFAQAALGDTVTVPTVHGETQIEIAPGTQTGETIRLPGMGLPALRGGQRGSQVVHVNVVTPTDLTDEQRRLLMEFALERGEDLRPPEHTGLFDRLRKVFTGEA